MAASSSSKKIREMSVDRLSALPDDILCYILSFLEMKEASITCLLSKRWQFLWTKLPGLRFVEKIGSDTEKINKFVIRVHRTLVVCSRRNLERFEINFKGTYGTTHIPFDVNVWIGFAIENELKEFSLVLPNVLPPNHVLPQMIYSNPSWTSLTLGGCTWAPRGTIQWQSLTKLRIEFAKLVANTFEKILSGCPVLSSLDLWNCWGYKRLEFNTPSLDRLAILDFEIRGDLIISAPYIRTLKIEVQCRNLFLKNIKSLVRAEVNVREAGCDATNLLNKRLKQHLGSVRSIKILNLGRVFKEFLSLIALEWQLPHSTGGCNLEIHAYCGDKSIPGILRVLESSPNLETLVIHFHESSKEDDIPRCKAPKNDLNCDLFHLKTVDFKSFRNPNVDIGEPVLKLSRILLKRAIVLEKMVVNFPTTSSSTTQDDLETT